MRGELGKYIFTQHLRRLQFPERDALPVFEYIDALGEHPYSKRKREYAGPALPSEDELWPLVANRNRFLADQSIRRLCVTVEGGVGKTKLLEELEASVAYDHPDQMVLRCELRELPTKPDFFLDSGDFFLVRCAEDEISGRRHDLQVQGLRIPDTHAVRAMVQAAARAGLLTIIVDAFDQLDKQGAYDRAKALKQFLSKEYYPRIRCIIAGRPYAIKRVWDALQLGELQSLEVQSNGVAVRPQKPVWEFCKLQKFDADQVKEYLSGVSAQDGADKLAALKRMDAEEIHLPRTLNIIRQLTAGELREMQTAADLYWHAMNKTIIDNFRRVRTEYQLQHLRVEHVLPIISAVACAMMFWKDQPVVEVPSIRTDKARDFFRFMKQVGFVEMLAAEGIDFELTLLDLAQVDSESLQFHFYSESPTREAPSEVRDIRMSDATVRDFFAAHWVARYLSPQLSFLKTQQTAEVDLHAILRKNVGSDDFKKFWQVLIGMPNEGTVSDREAATEASWVAAVSILFEVRKERPTELMYRCWPDLLWRAGFMEQRDHTDVPDWNDTPMAQATLVAQQIVRREFESLFGERGEAALDFQLPIDSARDLVTQFLIDYLQQCKRQELACMSDPKVTASIRKQFYLDCEFESIDIEEIPKRTAESEKERRKRLKYLNKNYPLWLMDRSFRVIDGGPFLYGDNPDPTNPARIETFELNAYLVSRAMYSFFDSSMNGGKALRAVVVPKWPSALIYSIWSHSRLASECEWEASARGKVGNLDVSEHWMFGVKGGEVELRAYAFFDRDILRRSSWLKSSSKIGKRLPTTQSELYDIHGYLEEWCSDIWAKGSVSRVLRGGAFRHGAIYTRCSFRTSYRPEASHHDYGCRISRAHHPKKF